MRVLMWEARGDADGLVAWWRGPGAAALPAGAGLELFRSADRVVALIRWGGPADAGSPQDPDGAPRLVLPEPPAALLARPPHAWPFTAVE